MCARTDAFMSDLITHIPNFFIMSHGSGVVSIYTGGWGFLNLILFKE